MHPNEQLLVNFYSAFQRGDADGMLACYSPDVEFSDAIFGTLRGAEAGDMWRMLCKVARDFELTYGDIVADDVKGKAHWEAHYTYSTGRRIHNVVDAVFSFRDGRIIKHEDHFDLWRWAAMALGPSGRALGWLSFMRNAIRAKASERLRAFRAELR